MKRLIIFLTFSWLLVNCASEGDYKEVPYDIIKPEKMIEIMIDIHIIESYFVTKGVDKDTSINLAASYYKYVVESHETDLETFYKSFQYYLNNAHIFYDIYEVVIERLSEMEAILREKKEGQENDL